ncbi:phosphoribosylanthranilate isomerase [Nitratifractor salsuginis]|uniref:N-(5'-phosphoribosyl)anthranilate isomerase n=1 Tax=Nitratifractor salsuginis (strain DSM 16511 / JCM 12458 / E9I37-1) TaxID=749222 RepID=E6WYQ3_NITSE|nr:phosphoribosylanthranilate isomerase [Nitratifractor salsuginis]ADV45424.1 phosphoribosylanthranilate isomerase [Nitratifractor salsuginis DSM 16511]
MKVKICGITNYNDAMRSIEAGADALGFVFYPKSPRYITPEAAREIIDRLPPFVEKVGLFVENTPEEIERMAKMGGITLAQIHFDVDEAFLDAVDFPVLPVVRARRLEDLECFADRYRLVDAYCEAYGGSGKRLNLEWFEGRDNSRIIIAGGLTPDNVEELRGYGFYGCDVSSGTEAAKGRKDPEKVMRFIERAKSL